MVPGVLRSVGWVTTMAARLGGAGGQVRARLCVGAGYLEAGGDDALQFLEVLG
jgi:hypothetical protein